MKRWFLILVVLALALPSAALGQGNLARLRFVQVAPGAPPLDMIVNGSTVFSNLAFRTATLYALVTSGTADLRVTPTGTGQAPLFDVTASLSACTDYTLLVVGTPGQVEPLLLLDDNSPPTPGQARVRFVNASPNAPAVDVFQQGGPLLFGDVPYKGAVGYASLNSGSHTFEVRQAGTGNVLLTLPDVVLESCSVYTIFLAGLLSGEPPLQAFATADAVTACAPPPTAVLPLAATPTSTSTPVPIIVPRPVATLTPSATPVPPSPTPLPTATATLAPTATPLEIVVTATPRATETLAPTATPTEIVVTATPKATETLAPTATATEIVVTATPVAATATAKATSTASATPTATGTLTPTLTATATLTPTLTATPVIPTPTAAATATPKAHATRPATPGITAVAPATPPADNAVGQQELVLPTPWWQLAPQFP